VDGGSVWYYCRNDGSLTIVGYVTKPSVCDFSRTPAVLRVETLTTGRIVFIDVLSTGSLVLPISRSVRLSYDSLNLIPLLPSNMIIRADFGTHKLAQDESRLRTIPNDGVVAVDKHTSLSYRIKEPTLDVKCIGNKLCVARGVDDYLPVFNKFGRMSSGHIYECKLRVKNVGVRRVLDIEEFHERYDKEKPNSLTVYNRIRDVMLSDKSVNEVISREVSSFSFAVRKYVYHRADGSRSSGRLIIDVGTNKLQSLSVMNELPAVSWLMVDPNIAIPSSANTRNWVDATLYDSNSIVNLLNDLNVGKVKFAYMRITIEQLLSNENVYMVMHHKRYPLVYSFSASYCTSTMNQLRRLGIPQIGCVFSYDNQNADGIVFDVGGMSMRVNKQTGKGDAVFDAHTHFEEYPVCSQDFPQFTVKAAMDVVAAYNEYGSSTKQIVSNILVITS
jgi:hypothetical protein